MMNVEELHAVDRVAARWAHRRWGTLRWVFRSETAVWVILCVGLVAGCRTEAPPSGGAVSSSAPSALGTTVLGGKGAAPTASVRKDEGAMAQVEEVDTEKEPPPSGAPQKAWGDVSPPRAAVELSQDARIDPVEVQRTVDGRFERLKPCLREDTTVRVSMKIDAGGVIGQTRVLASQPDSPLLRDCVAAALNGGRVANSQGTNGKPITMKLILRKDGE
jgi:hypothetical protein